MKESEHCQGVKGWAHCLRRRWGRRLSGGNAACHLRLTLPQSCCCWQLKPPGGAVSLQELSPLLVEEEKALAEAAGTPGQWPQERRQ